MISEPHVGPHLRDPALRVYQERRAFGSQPQHGSRAVLGDDALLAIRDHRVGEPVLLDELDLRLRLVATDAHDLGGEGLQLTEVCLEVLRFVGSTGRVGHWIEEEYHPLAGLLGE